MHITFNKNIIQGKTKRKFLLGLIFVFPILFVLGMLWLRNSNFQLYRIIGKEDGIIEWLQFFLFGASGIISFVLALKFRKISKIMFIIFLLLSFGFIFTAGEEISWGQRIFGVEGREIFQGEEGIPLLGRNVQSETNLHNFKNFHNKVGYMYIAIGTYGCFAWFLACIFDKLFDFKEKVRKFLPFFVSPPYLFFYFLPLGINLLPRMEWGIIPPDYEMAEFLLSLGIFVFLLLGLLYFDREFLQRERSQKKVN
jgi:hypothetical protein